MRLTGVLPLAAALSLAAAPVFAQSANPAAKLSLTADDASSGAPAKHKVHASTLLIGGAALVAVVVAAVALSHHDSKAASA